jgi:flagellar basal body rod protein FlgF
MNTSTTGFRELFKAYRAFSRYNKGYTFMAVSIMALEIRERTDDDITQTTIKRFAFRVNSFNSNSVHVIGN